MKSLFLLIVASFFLSGCYDPNAPETLDEYVTDISGQGESALVKKWFLDQYMDQSPRNDIFRKDFADFLTFNKNLIFKEKILLLGSRVSDSSHHGSLSHYEVEIPLRKAPKPPFDWNKPPSFTPKFMALYSIEMACQNVQMGCQLTGREGTPPDYRTALLCDCKITHWERGEVFVR